MENCINEFKKYTSNFDFTDDRISRKYNHTFRVVEYAKDISKHEKLNEHDSYILLVCALLHDIGRFEQARKFNTFIDFKTCDHGDIGYDILIKDNYINKFVKTDEDTSIVLKAVKNHNKLNIDPTLSKKEYFITKLLQDADKIDILDTQLNDILDNKYFINKDALKALKAHLLYDKKGSRPNDATSIVASLCLIFDLYSKRSLELIIQKDIISRKLNILKKHFDLNQITDIENILKEYLIKENKLSLKSSISRRQLYWL